MIHPSRLAIAGLVVAGSLAGCATDHHEPTPEEAYRKAVAEARRGHYLEAQELFEKVRDADTPVRLELLAEVGIADALYKEGKYEEAAQAYADLLQVHSGDAIADYLNYQLAMCYYRRIDTVDRDQGLTRKARSQFMALIRRYPESDLVPAAREKLAHCNDYLARRELYVGRFYLERGNPRAAAARFTRGLTAYGKVAVVPELLHELCLAQDALGDTAAADRTAERLLHDYPDSPWAKRLAADRAAARERRAGGHRGLLDRLRGLWHREAPPAEAAAGEAAPGHEAAAPAKGGDTAPPPAASAPAAPE
ncbi:MAG: outer membrane protein assembly factor BamD, partial [Nitrospirae bacterium]